MQKGHMRLMEIIWEITGRCQNGCKYCGSKDAWNEEIDPLHIIAIANEIAKHPPEEIDISGGDPLLVDYDTHKAVTKILRDAGVKVKILANPKSFSESLGYARKVFELYDWVGISVNTSLELQEVQAELNSLSGYHLHNATIISNFNLENVFSYEAIEKFVQDNNLMWQVQYTVYHDKDDSLALYNNADAREHFFKLLDKSINNNLTKIILADNLTNGPCGAGICSLGILSNGDVVPCLSMRSWCNMEKAVVANILEPQTSFGEAPNLMAIWRTRFDAQRFECFKCCKDHCMNKAYNPLRNADSSDEEAEPSTPFDEIPMPGKPEEPKIPNQWPYPPDDTQPPRSPIVVLYGVTPNYPVEPKGPSAPPGVYVYAVPGGWRDYGTGTAIYSVQSGGSYSTDPESWNIKLGGIPGPEGPPNPPQKKA